MTQIYSDPSRESRMSIETAREILKPHIWTHPSDYGGFSPDGDYCIATQNRDSDALTRSNYRRIFADIKAEAHDDRDADNERPVAYDWRAGHWMCGWIEYLMVRHDAPDALLIQCAEIVAALSDYPVYDESDYSELEWNGAADYWARCSVKDRVEMIRETQCGASIFAARRDELPRDDSGALFEHLRG